MSKPDFTDPTFCTREQARRLALALDAIEQRLARLGPKSHPDTIAEALAEPIRIFDLAARES